MRLDRLLKSATSHVEIVKVSRTGINPLLWLVGLVAPLAMVLAVILVLFGGERALNFAFAITSFAAIPVLLAFGAYFMLLWRRPEMLESEEYRLRRHAMLISYERGASAEILDAREEALRLQSGKADLGKEQLE